MSLTVFLSGYEYKNEYKYEREKSNHSIFRLDTHVP